MSLYQHGRRTSRQKDNKAFLKAAFVFAIALISAAWILQKDLATDSKERTTVPIVTNVSEQTEDVIEINEPLFTMKLPSDWKQVDRVQKRFANYYEWQATKQGGDDRMLRLHIDIMPASYKLVRMQPLTVEGNRFVLGNISGDCMDFAKDTDRPEARTSNQEVEAKWESVRFMCDPIEANQTVGTGTVQDGIAARIGQHKYFFYYEDHNIRPDDQILINALKSFRAR